jgi:hypothetical protein
MVFRSIVVLVLTGTLGATSLIAQAPRRVAPAAPPKPASAAPSPTPAPPSLATNAITNQDILRMVQAGLGESVVLATIRTAPATRFDLSPDGLIALKKGGVSDAIVAVMIDPKAVPVPSTPAVAPALFTPAPVDTRARVDSATASPEIPRDPGIYLDKGRDGTHDLTALEPTVFSQGKTGGMFTSALTYGVKKVKMKAVTRGSAAGFHVTQRQPTFYFYFEAKGSGLGNTGGFSGWLAGATSPNEFVLARMTSTSKDRELVVGEWGAFGGNSGTRSKDTVDLQIEKLTGGVYRVRPAAALDPGEYCFFYAGGVSALGALGGGNAGKLFDFGIYDEKAGGAR